MPMSDGLPDAESTRTAHPGAAAHAGRVSSGRRIPPTCFRCGWPRWTCCWPHRSLPGCKQAIAAGDTGYPRGQAYARALRSFAADRWAWTGVDIEATAVVPDVMMGIVEVLRLITEPGDAVVVCAPVYPPFYAFVTHADRTRYRGTDWAMNWRLDLDALAAAFATARQVCDHPVLLLCNPHNPTGVVHTRAELTALATLARSYGVRVIADEIHAPLVLTGAEFVPYLSVPGTEDAFALYSASKAWNLAAFKAALVVAGPDAATDLARLPEEVSHLPSHLGVLSHVAAFEEGRPWLDALRRGLDANRTLLADLADRTAPRVNPGLAGGHLPRLARLPHPRPPRRAARPASWVSPPTWPGRRACSSTGPASR